MAGNQMIVVLAIMITAFSMADSAVDYIVGDDAGWTVGFNYQAWASDKEFHVGDTLVFVYPAGAHNVLKVNGTSFASCTKSPNLGGFYSGYDQITLATTGNKWYICGVGGHCEGGQKLKITVLPESIAPAMTPGYHSDSIASAPMSAMTPGYYSEPIASEPVGAMTPGYYLEPIASEPVGAMTPGYY